MIKIKLIAIGKIKEKFFADAINEYAKRIGRFASFEIIELPERRTLEEEGEDILKKVSGTVAVFDIDGDMLSSTELAEFIKNRSTYNSSEISFVIGSSEGLSPRVKSAAGKRISFGRVTYPHQLMRVIASEQIYRALTVINNVTYHK